MRKRCLQLACSTWRQIRTEPIVVCCSNVHWLEQGPPISDTSHLTGLLAVFGLGIACSTSCAAKAEESKDESGGKHSGSKTAQWRVYTDMGKKMAEEGKMEEAEDFLKSALECAQQGFGLMTPHVGAACNNLAELYRLQGRLEEAKELYQQAIEVLLDSYGESDLRTAAVQHNLGSIHQQLGEMGSAEDCFKRAMGTRVRLLGKSHSESLLSKLKLARVKLQQKDTKSGRNHALECSAILEEKGIGVDTLGALSDCISILFSTKGGTEAKRLLVFVMQTIRNSKSSDQFRLAQTCDRLIHQLQECSEFDSARDVANECQKMQKQWLGDNHMLVAASFRHMADIEQNDPKGSSEKALQASQNAVRISTDGWKTCIAPTGWFGLFGHSTPPHKVLMAAIECCRAHNCMARALLRLGREEESQSTIAKAVRLVTDSRELMSALEDLQQSRSQFAPLVKAWKTTLAEQNRLSPGYRES
ncbi:hypothetical protein BSKO_00635 [Bryopsis sp. KO-2023]|nr:hypothetical protein BSKO_00635 [Bryopsis sp. KO-2023]